MATVDDKKVIFSMVGVSKTIQQNQKQVLKNIYLSFFYGAKIGIIGLNGAGKSTLMKIIAGLDQQVFSMSMMCWQNMTISTSSSDFLSIMKMRTRWIS